MAHDRARAVAARRWLQGAAVLLLVATAAAGSALPAAASSDPAELTPAQLAAQLRQAQQLQGDLAAASAAVAAAQLNLLTLADRSSLLLQRLAESRAEAAAAAAEQQRLRAELTRLDADLLGRERELGRWAARAYVTGSGPLEDLAAIVEVLTTSGPRQGADSLALLGYLTDERTRRFERLAGLRERHQAALSQAQAAGARAATATREAQAARVAVADAVLQQQRAVEAFRRAETAVVSRQTLRARLLASGAGADPGLLAGLGSQIPTVGTCAAASGDYPNGRLPARALCPVYRAPGEFLREPAARAFNALSLAYQRDSGRPLCVTDAYRSYAEQVAVYAARPHLAARPGTSQHGLGLAVDLCGGVQSFGDPAHLWMRQNAPLYGWFHPSWAGPRGSKPEPWHWEFAG